MRTLIALLTFALCSCAPAQTPAAYTDYTMPPSGQVTVPAEGGVTFQMSVNGHGPFPTIFDTGGVNLISSSFAERLGLKVEQSQTAFGAIGGSVKVRTTHVDTLTIAGLAVHNQLFYVLDIPADAGAPQLAIGWEFMQRFAVRIDFKHNQLTFFDAQHFRYAGPGTPIPLLLHANGNGIDVMADVDGVAGRFQIDSGNQVGVFFNAGFVNQHHLVEKLHAHYRGYNGRGFGGPSPEAWFVRLPTLSLGPLTVHGPLARLQTADDSFDQELAGNIGQDILNRFLATVDTPHAVLYLEKTAGWDQPGVFNRSGLIVDYNQGADEIKTVLPAGPGEAAGLRPGDRIVTINGQMPADDANDPAFLAPVGTVLHLEVERNHTTRRVDLTLRDLL